MTSPNVNKINPVALAAAQSQPTADAGWSADIRRIFDLTINRPGFKNQPRANRFDAILEAVVPSRQDPTHEKVLAVVNALVQAHAVRADEAGQLYNALLHRVSRYNSMNVQTNLERLVTDVKDALGQRERNIRSNNLGSLVALNGFLATLPSVVERGQDSYVSFVSALKLMVSEVPQSEVYQSGPDFYFQTTRSGSQTVNLTKAFENLRQLWGVKAQQASGSAISSLLTPNTRLLLLLIAPFTDSVGIPRGTYIGHLLTLYRETLGQTQVAESTYQEITQVSRAFGEENADNLQATLNFLLTNRQQKLPTHYVLTEEEERVLRYVQQSVALFLMQDGATPSTALDRTAANFEPTMYAANRPFINRLMDYLHRAAAASPNYFTNVILNANWQPPQGFFTGDFEMPEPEEEAYAWDDINSSLASMSAQRQLRDKITASLPSLPSSRPSTPLSASRRGSLSDLGAAAPRELDPGSAGLNLERELESMFQDKDNNLVDSLTDKMARWKTYRNTQSELERLSNVNLRHPASGERRENADDGPRSLRDRDLSGHGLRRFAPSNPFGHLMPQGGRRRL
ncbi:pIIIa [Bat mastadenovirus WIV11]|uniref:Pre-hexon-linking protein IIIa n=1 Tax=Bat mastadenovirus WIV11 TaxID=1788433 RepID=A0A161DIP1_9ADEN|nr:pIIIa [Bat mastadenovirus WIV11]AMB43118.1 pIIIa [Bat mastadenovirus WIV11]